MYKDRLLKFGGFLFSLKGVIWLLGALAWSVGLIDRIIFTFSDGHIVAKEVFQLVIISAILVSWFYLKPSSRINNELLTGIDGIGNLNQDNSPTQQELIEP